MKVKLIPLISTLIATVVAIPQDQLPASLVAINQQFFDYVKDFRTNAAAIGPSDLFRPSGDDSHALFNTCKDALNLKFEFDALGDVYSVFGAVEDEAHDAPLAKEHISDFFSGINEGLQILADKANDIPLSTLTNSNGLIDSLTGAVNSLITFGSDFIPLFPDVQGDLENSFDDLACSFLHARDALKGSSRKASFITLPKTATLDRTASSAGGGIAITLAASNSATAGTSKPSSSKQADLSSSASFTGTTFSSSTVKGSSAASSGSQNSVTASQSIDQPTQVAGSTELLTRPAAIQTSASRADETTAKASSDTSA